MGKLNVTLEVGDDETPRTLVLGPRWLDYCDLDDGMKNMLDDWDALPEEKQTIEMWRSMQPSDEVLDGYWTKLMEGRLRQAITPETRLPLEFQAIIDGIIQKGPHRMTAPVSTLEALSHMLEREAEDASHDCEYELSVLRSNLFGRVE